MPRPIKHKEMLRRLRTLGWDGPSQKGKHPFMIKGEARLTIPNPHHGDIDWSLMKRILQNAEISSDEWEKA
jgi:predicted RNA binding protein YcfA (HicA-like mRNA interferase family)